MRTVTDYKKLNIKNIVSNIRSVKDYVRFNGHKVKLTTTSPNYGGVRYWFLCPACNKRKATLYQLKSVIACRTCAKLYYPLQDNKVQRNNISQFLYYDRLLSKTRTELNPKFEWAFHSYLRYDPITSSLHNKPKGMHLTTYVHKLEYIDSLTNKMHNCMQVINLDKQHHADKINKQIDMIFSSR
ncbi:hypothetical protein [Leuconostoc gasicomitatum]|uniref:hypothetical protein n=1 Tax=Leuconostoc gasicomitatum TaxID=115778 RepID=UPI00074497E2|nr:hypothetical protein [Leuconostoc gasicomitatum]MBZ5953701.1 hypothetical protein [Leuconostoc gasicomitatum]MBZ5954822.1 hypothetical protein [Leuconostoc gasicomitatum]MBZ5988949.1 hypothetical protein [Leuconostoc gasicomitatum]MBZ5989742.1 hypothetical protein [Leuconostoc gasicomitatum]CUR64324.1 Uncharacterized protein LEKG_1737 [Leuconostoc gasicomitatum KG16-1]